MGYRGKVRERDEARRLRAQAWTLQEIADRLGVAKSSVSLWVRDVEFVPRPRAGAQRRAPNALQRRKEREIEDLLAAGRERVGCLSERDFLIAGTALYPGEGDKTDGRVGFANTDARFVRLFCDWLRHFFEVDESRLRVWLHLHQGLDLDAAVAFWSGVTGVPRGQSGKPYRALADPTHRRTKHVHGCVRVSYSCSRTHRAVMGLVDGLQSAGVAPGTGAHRRV